MREGYVVCLQQRSPLEKLLDRLDVISLMFRSRSMDNVSPSYHVVEVGGANRLPGPRVLLGPLKPVARGEELQGFPVVIPEVLQVRLRGPPKTEHVLEWEYSCFDEVVSLCRRRRCLFRLCCTIFGW